MRPAGEVDVRVPAMFGLLVVACAALAGCGSVSATFPTNPGQARAAVASPSDAMPGVAGLVVAPEDGSMAGPLTPVARRTAGSVTLRLFTQPVSGGNVCASAGACTPAPCQPSQQLVTELSTPAIAAVLTSPVIGPGSGSAVSVLETMSSTGSSGAISPTTVGQAEGSPVQVAVVHVGSDVARVTLRTADGSDSTAPVKGLAALAVAGSSTSGDLTALDSHGHPLAGVNLPAPPTAATAACQPALPPTVLPAPGPQPADPTSATQAVQAAFHTAFTAVPNQAPYASLATVQDGSDLHGALDQLRQNFSEAAATASVTTGKVVFTSPTAAAAEFTLNYTGGAAYGTQIGTVGLENGSWLVSRSTYCDVLAFGGATCPAG